MELIFLVIIIAILISIFTGNPGYILVGVSGLLLLFAGLLTVVFLYCTICLLFSKKKEAVFSRIDHLATGQTLATGRSKCAGEVAPLDRFGKVFGFKKRSATQKP